MFQSTPFSPEAHAASFWSVFSWTLSRAAQIANETSHNQEGYAKNQFQTNARKVDAFVSYL
jgi:hypothetical protein